MAVGRRRASVLILGALVFGAAVAAFAEGDAAAGRKQAQSCTTCHGPLGIGQLPNTPNLAGQPAIYLVAQLKAFRSGKRTHEVMNVVAKPLSDGDIEDLAAWFSSIEVTAKPRP